MKFLLIAFLLLPYLGNTQITIAEARKMKTGNTVTVHGQVTATFGDLSFIQDHSGGIAIYGIKVIVNDSISVTGKLSKFNGLLEIIADSIKVIDADRKQIIPKVVNSLAGHEAELVKLQDVQVLPPGLFFYEQRGGILINQKSDTIHYWIDENTDIPGYVIPGTSNITGIVSRYGSRFQLMPRSHTDIDNAISDQPTTNNNFTILNWNLEFFGAPKYGPTNDVLQIANVAKLLNFVHPDIIALQEVSNDDAFRNLLQLLPGYNGRCSNRYSYSFDTSGDFPPQKLCFVYKSSVVDVVREKILFRKMFDDDPSNIFSSGRLPYLLQVEALGRQLHLVNYHGKSGDGPDDRARRLTDARLLKDTLDHFYAGMNVVLLGDFNDDMDESITLGYETPYMNFATDSHYNCVTKSLSTAGWHSTISYDDIIDHQIISISLIENYVTSNVVNVFRSIPLYGKTTSDHLPIISEFDFTKVVTGVIEQEINVFPNPTTGEIYVPENSDVTILNSTGTIVFKSESAHSPISIDKCAPGLYLLILDNDVFRIIKI